MTISIISELVPRASGGFPVADIDNIRGGYKSVSTIADRDAIAATLLKEGQLVYVAATGFAYRYTGGSWIKDTVVASGQSYSSGFSTSKSVTFMHNMGYYPNVNIIDTNGDRIWGNVAYNNLNQITVTFNQSITGTGYLS